MPEDMNLIMPGSQGADVQFAKRLLMLYELCNLTEGELFDDTMESQVREFQIKCGLEPDGKIGPRTWKYLAPNLTNDYTAWNKKEAVQAVQSYLKKSGYVYFNPDGNYGVSTLAAVEDFQTKNRIFSDGIWGGECWKIWSSDAGKDTVKIQPKAKKALKSIFSFSFHL